ncbi:MAG: subclass B1 metallo-beta-lactamase [Reichenbachiella sp.]
MNAFVKGLISLFIASSVLGCTDENTKVVFESENLKLIQLTENTFVHISYLQTNDFGKVACNGLVYINNGEAAVLDTPTDSLAALELISWVEDQDNTKLKYVVPTHFHSDCLGSLDQFHSKGVTSVCHTMTKDLIDTLKQPIPKVTFSNQEKLTVGSSDIILEYFGPGHTIDNIIAYVQEDNVLFGGCLVKSIGASKGYTGDADTTSWSSTVRKINKKYLDIVQVVPGHGSPGNQSLLEYTAELFE